MDEIIKKLSDYNARLADLNVAEGIQLVLQDFPGIKKCSTSFGIEDQVLTHILYPHAAEVSFFTLDTGRQFNETYEVFQKTQDKYPAIDFKVYYPQEQDVRNYVATDGINGFYNSMESRKKCCYVRKVVPLQTALEGTTIWITGLRAEQSNNRETMQFLEWDDANKVIKFNPLLEMTLVELEELVAQHNIPINSLYKKGYLSIGCAPCTRAIAEGEDFRAGRWWWESGKKECGLHLQANRNN